MKSVSKKSVSKKLNEASELAAVLRLQNNEIEYFHIGYGLSCKLTPIAFRRVFLHLKLKRSRLKNELDYFGDGDARYSFEHRGCEFWCLVPKQIVEQWALEQLEADLIEHSNDKRVLLPSATRKPLRLPAPEVVDV
jgi:hypothetical protein